MNLPINVKSPNNISKWQVGFNSAFKGLNVSRSEVTFTATYSRDITQVQEDDVPKVALEPYHFFSQSNGLITF
jgi:hypothetical protein